jgi:hypothetical protein
MFFQGELTECLSVDYIILILVPTFYKIGKNDSYILKNYEFFYYNF